MLKQPRAVAQFLELVPETCRKDRFRDPDTRKTERGQTVAQQVHDMLLQAPLQIFVHRPLVAVVL